MTKYKRLITKKYRYFTVEEAHTMFELLAYGFNNATYQLREITKNSYAIQILNISDDDKIKLKEQLKNEYMCDIYKSNDTWNDIVKRQKERENKKEA